MGMMDPSPLTAYAERLLEHAKALDSYNAANGLENPSFEHESFKDLPLDIEGERNSFVDLAQDMKRLVQGPRDLLWDLINLFVDVANFHFIYHFNIPQYVPLQGSISYADLAAATGFDEVFLRRMLRVAMINRLFLETKEGRVQHSAATRILVEEPDSMDACGFLLEEFFPAAPKMVEAIKKYPLSGEPNETAFNIAHNTSRPFYLELKATPERTRRFGGAMRWMSQGGRFSNDHLARGYDWAQFDHADGVMVDVGGGHGAVSRALAQTTNNMRFIVQDLPLTASQGAKILPTELADRVSFMAHDFFTEQPVKGADVYFLRYIVHNWSDKYAEQILKAIIPAMKEGSRIVCVEFLPDDASITAWTRKQVYNIDTLDVMGWNSLERTSSDWERLFKSVDSRLEYLGSTTPPGCTLSLIEAKFTTNTNGISTNGQTTYEERSNGHIEMDPYERINKIFNMF